MAEAIRDGVRFAGEIDIQDITLICSSGVQFDLKPFLVELNLTEDIFSPSVYGNIMLADSLGLIEKGPIIGEEYIRINVTTPGLNSNISKTFRVYMLSDRYMNGDISQTFILHFCSQEVFVDTISKLYKAFSGRIDQVAGTIYNDYLKTSRNIVINKDTNQFVDSGDATDMTIFNETDNNIKFVAPGWGALKTLSWLASKGITKGTKAADNLFFESSKGYYWGSMGRIMTMFKEKKAIAGQFYYAPSNLKVNPTATVSASGVQYRAPTIAREYSIMENFNIVDSFNTLKANQTGYYANQMLTVDLINKSFKYNNFDYVKDFSKYPHLEKNAPFTAFQWRNPIMARQTAIQQPGLYTGVQGNVSERIAEISQNRISLLGGLSNIKIEGTVPGRTDYEVGTVVYFGMPKIGPKDGTDKVEEFDMYLSGLYLVSCIRHKITLYKHMCNIELVKDSLSSYIA